MGTSAWSVRRPICQPWVSNLSDSPGARRWAGALDALSRSSWRRRVLSLEGQRNENQRLAVVSLRSERAEARFDLSGQPRSVVLSEEGTWRIPKDLPVPAWTGGDRVLSYVATTDQVIAGGRSPRPGRRTSRGRHLRRSEGALPFGSGWPQGLPGAYSGGRAQARLIKCTLSMLTEASTPSVRAVS